MMSRKTTEGNKGEDDGDGWKLEQISTLFPNKELQEANNLLTVMLEAI